MCYVHSSTSVLLCSLKIANDKSLWKRAQCCILNKKNNISQNRTNCFFRQSRCIMSTSRLETGPSSSTSGCSNTVICSLLTSALTAKASRKPHFLRRTAGKAVGDPLDAIFAPRRTLPVQSVLFSAEEFGYYSRWLIPSTIPGASQLFKTLLT